MTTDKDYSATLIELDQETNKFRSAARYNKWREALDHANTINDLSVELLRISFKYVLDLKK